MLEDVVSVEIVPKRNKGQHCLVLENSEYRGTLEQ